MCTRRGGKGMQQHSFKQACGKYIVWLGIMLQARQQLQGCSETRPAQCTSCTINQSSGPMCQHYAAADRTAHKQRYPSPAPVYGTVTHCPGGASHLSGRRPPVVLVRTM